MNWAIIETVYKTLQPFILSAALTIGGYLYGVSNTTHKFEMAAIQKKVSDLAVIEVANQADRLKAVQQQNTINELNKKLQDVRSKITNKDRSCLDAADTDQLRNLWQR